MTAPAVRIYRYKNHHIVIAPQVQPQGITAVATVSRSLPEGGCEAVCIALHRHRPSVAEAIDDLALTLERRIDAGALWGALRLRPSSASSEAAPAPLRPAAPPHDDTRQSTGPSSSSAPECTAATPPPPSAMS